MTQFAVTVDLPERYWTAQFYIEADNADEAESSAEALLEALRELIPDAELQVTDVEPIDVDNT